MICPNCGSDKIDQFKQPGPIWCRKCGLSAPNKLKYNPFIAPSEDTREDNLRTFSGYSRYITKKEEKLCNAISDALGTLKVPAEADGGVAITVRLIEVTTMEEAGEFQSFVCGDVDINMGFQF